MNRACLGPGDGYHERCPFRALSPQTRCPACSSEHQRRRDAVRGTPHQRGYNAEYVRNRALVLAGGPHPCAWGCGRIATTVDHIVPLALGGTNDVENLMPADSICNSSRGSRSAPSAWARRGDRW